MPPVTLLFVCTANLCRSPLAAALADTTLADVSHVRVLSAGTRGVDGRPLPEATVDTARTLGLRIPDTSRALTVDAVREADLVLGMTRTHRRDVVRLDRSANRKVFTLLEFARVVDVLARRTDEAAADPDRADGASETDGALRLRTWLDEAALFRGLAPRALTPDEDDVTDPFPAPERLFGRTLAEMTPALDRVTSAIVRQGGQDHRLAA